MQSFTVQDMTCGHCVRAVTDAVHTVDPAATVEVDLAAGRVMVRDMTAPATEIASAITSHGYPAEFHPATEI